MTETRKDSESIGISPFQEEIVLENYFPGANRGEVLSQMNEAMQNGVVLMVLTGEEGSGKTMLCRVLEHEASPLCKTVFFSRPVDSFEEVVRIIGRGLKLDAVDGMHGGDIDQALEQIIAFLLDESVYLLVIFDEAENIFLATLGRIRKMLDWINESGARMHILFSGRETFLENCDQLSICDFQNANELHFPLAPLSEAETADYLEDCAARLTDMDATEIFTEEVISNIYELAKGNFRMTNILGEESAKINGDDTSFMVLLDSVKESDDAKGKAPDAERYLNLLRVSFAYLPWIGGAACCLLLLLFLFNSGDDGKNVGRDVNRSEQLETMKEVRKSSITDRNNEQKKSIPGETAEQMPEKDTSEREAMAVTSVPISSLQYIDQLPGEVKHIPAEVGEVAEIAESEATDEVVEKVVVEAEEIVTPQKTMTEEAENVVLLRPDQDLQALKKKPGSASESLESPESPVRITKDQSRTKAHKAIVTKSHFAADKLYNERLSAGLGWKKGTKEGMYTVQLMALASKTAEKNLKKMLAQSNYRQEAGNFYILKKSTASEKIFVFYGEYPSIERARLVTNSLPKFLRDHKPYVLSIKGAVAKIRN
jgi:type II secretory pathway predicted ATPase ExeA/septal ring-binding cell division protein DamX